MKKNYTLKSVKNILMFILLMCSSGFAFGQVSLANSWTSSLNTHTIGIGTNRVLIYIITMEDDSNTNDVTAVTYGGQSMTQAVQADLIVGAALQKVEIWYLKEIGVTAATSSSFVPTFSHSNPFTGGHGYYTMAVTLQDVNQSTTICSIGSGTEVSTSTVNLDVAVSVLPSEIFIYGTSGGQPGSHTPATGYTEGVDVSGLSGGQAASANHKLTTSTSSENPTATSSVIQNRFVIAGVRIPPVGGTCSSALPIKLLGFTATPTSNQHVRLEWTTALEVNNDYFAIERSNNGLEWKEITRINGAGDSAILLNYSTIDSEPYSGISYYRLKQIDFDGQFEYSKVIAVNIAKLAGSQIQIYPNPTENLINIIGNKSDLKQLKIYNILRQDVTNQTKKIRISGSKLVIDLSNLATGVYYVKTRTAANKVYKQ